jgi:DNA replication protein DnaC
MADHAGKIAKQVSGKIIGRRKYDALKQFNLEENLDDDITMELFNAQFPDLSVGEALKMIKAYEEEYKPIQSKAFQEKIADQWDKIYEEKPKKEVPELTKQILWKKFSKNYRQNEGVDYSDDYESLENIKPLFFYFLGQFDEFQKCKAVSLQSKPDPKKGILIIGGYGNGKTSVMRALEKSLRKTNVTFRIFSANEVVDMYEACQNSYDKEEFWKTMTTGAICFDDVLTEREASNYGKVNVMKDILEKRYDLGKRTYLTINYKDGTDNDLMISLGQLGMKYGSRVYDRIYSMFNIVEFKGRSRRK